MTNQERPLPRQFTIDSDEIFNEILNAMPYFEPPAILTQDSRRGLCNRYARAGFAMVTQGSQWTANHDMQFYRRFEIDLNDEVMDWFEEGIVPISAFISTVVGALYAMYADGEIDDPVFLVLDAHLAGYSFMEDFAICEKYAAIATA